MRTFPSRVAGEREPAVVSLALQKPDRNIRRVVPLMKSKLNQPAFEFEPAPKKTPARITLAVEDHIVALSLEHPDHGARRLLPLLEAEGISASSSTVYRILRSRGLQNRSMRLWKLEAQQAAQALSPQAAAMPVPQDEPTVLPAYTKAKLQPEAAKPKPVAQMPAGKVPLTRIPRISKKPAKSNTSGAGVLTLVNILLFALLLYIGFHTVQKFRSANAEPQTPVAVSVSAFSAAKAPQTAVRPLTDYRIIRERNLFNVSKEEAPEPKKEIAVEKIALAEKDLGLKLVGTVAADDIQLRRAFIDDSRTRRQEAYREGETAGEVRIVKILRNKVIVATREGDRLLSVEMEGTGNRAAASPNPLQSAWSPPIAQGSAESREPELDVVEARLKRAQVESGLSEDDYLMKQVRILPYTDIQGEQPGGFRISNIRAGNVLLQMGLRSGDVVTEVNGEPVSGPDDAAAFFRRLHDGGEVTINISRRNRPIQIHLDIG